MASSSAGQGAGSGSRFCDRSQELTAAEQSRLLRFAGVLRAVLGDDAAAGAAGGMTNGAADGMTSDASGGATNGAAGGPTNGAAGGMTEGAGASADSSVALVSRSGLDLSRFGIRYSHAALAWRSDAGVWAARQLYYACDERRPRIFDQGLAGFAMGTDDPKLGYISVVRLPPEAVLALRPALLDRPRVTHLLAAQYSANAYAFSTRYQNCNQWVAEMLAAGWGDLADDDHLRERAQDWLRTARYTPAPVAIDSWWLMQAGRFVPLLHLDDHPDHDRAARQLVISLPTSLERFVQYRFPASERVELCHDDKRVVVRHGWTPIADGCVPDFTQGDRVIALD
ncbi:DUF2145 domain-containing protein [Duganella sp. Leaf126]|uniref:DUF2145 domain-containing protein n=1 Tax=Duganella sp. Leaf126 TaxID=1736266 RepID=UPI0009E77C44|nr:DUF2145 domain-containing protein [Duganella sp. Leaf126]